MNHGILMYARRATRRGLPLLLLSVFFAQVVTASLHLSLTSDEGPQLTSAYAYLTTGDPLLLEHDGHPPLAKIWNALPLLFIPDLGSPSNAPSWRSQDPISLLWVTQEFFYPYHALERLTFPPRAMTALLGVLLLAIVHRWAADLFNPWAGLGALFMATFDPNLLAHAGLATNDLAVTVACTAALFAAWRYLRHPGLVQALLIGLTLGLSQSTKLNAVLLLPVIGLLLLFHAWRHRCRTLMLTQTLLIFAVAGLSLWSTYGFELRAVHGLPIRLPAGTHLLLWEPVLRATGGGHPAFLMGELSSLGWWYYFPVAFAIKTPVPTLLALMAGATAFLSGRRRRWRDELALWAFVPFYGGFIIYSRLNIGYRHLLPVLPLLLVGTARLFQPNLWRAWPSRVLSGALGLWLVVAAVQIWPFQLSYFNELVGGPEQGYRYLVDSNLDWGQAFKALARYQQTHPGRPILLSTYIEYGPALRHAYGIDYIPLPPLNAAPGQLPRRFNPDPGIYAISATTLQGVLMADPGTYDWFRHRQPDVRLGHGLFVYHVAEAEPSPSWIAQCTQPLAPLPSDVIAEGFGKDNLRHIAFDCTQSWLLPADEGGGWYALFRDTARRDDRFIRAQLDPWRKSFEQRDSGFQPPFVIYEATTSVITPALPVEGNVEIAGLSFLGHTPEQAGRQLEIWTHWEVRRLPDEPVSLMLHLVGQNGAVVSVGDGLGIPQTQWRIGDRLVQRHQLTAPDDAPAGTYIPQTGVYELATLIRLPVTLDGEQIGDAVSLYPVTLP